MTDVRYCLIINKFEVADLTTTITDGNIEAHHPEKMWKVNMAKQCFKKQII